MLRPGGMLAISVPHARWPFWWDPDQPVWIALGGRPIRSGPIAGIWSNHVRLYEPAELEDAGPRQQASRSSARGGDALRFPFSHFLVYGIGKPLVERISCRGGCRRPPTAFEAREHRAALNPFNAGRAVFGSSTA